MTSQPHLLLIADDSEADRFFLRQAVRSGDTHFKIAGEVEDGDEAIGYLAGRDDFADRDRFPMPDVLFLDLRMRRGDGFAVLEWLRSPPIPELRVVVWSDTSDKDDWLRVRDLGVRYFFKKASMLGQLIHSLQVLDEELVGTYG